MTAAIKNLETGEIDFIAGNDIIPKGWKLLPEENHVPSPDAPEVVDTATFRKRHPVATGVVDYFPDALMAIAHVSWVGNEQHNPGTHVHWDRAKSGDESDALMRHFLRRGKTDTDGISHTAKMAWRALALLQKELENGS